VPSGTTYSWSAPSGTGFTGGSAGSGASNISGTLVNATTAYHTATYTVTPTAASCTCNPFTVAVTITPYSQAPVITSTLLCSGTTVGGTTPETQSQTITVYDGTTAIGNVSLPAGQMTWWVTPVSPALVSGSSITAQISGVSCPSAPSAPVIVAAPNAGTVSGTTPLCVGAISTYTTNGDAGGSWSSSAPTVASVDAASGNITALSAGTATITYTISDGTCVKTATKSVTVTTAQTSTISAGGPTTFCNGGSVVLTAGGGTNYTWSTGATTSSITVSVSGTYTVSITSGCGSSSSAPTTVTVNSPPVGIITGNATYCAGTPAILSAATSVAGSGSINGYQWYMNGTALGADANNANGTSVNYTASAPGTYTVRITDSNGCSTLACP